MDGDLFGVGPPAENAKNKTVGSYSDEPSLLDFASPPPSQDAANDVNFLQQPQQSQPEPSQNLFDFGATVQSPPQEAPPLVDLFGGPQLLPSSTLNPVMTPNTTLQPQGQASLDLFGAPIPAATTTPSLPEATPMVDAFAPVASPAPATATTTSDDPFAVFLQPQHQPPQASSASFPDPFSAFTGNLSVPSKPEPKSASTMMTAEAAAAATTASSDSLLLSGKPESISDRIQTTNEAKSATESDTPPRVNPTIAKPDEEEKKDQDFPTMPVESAKQETVAAAVDVASSTTDPVEIGHTKAAADASSTTDTVEIGDTKEAADALPTEGGATNANTEADSKSCSEEITEKEPMTPPVSAPNNMSTPASEAPEQEKSSVHPTSDATSDEKTEEDDLQMVDISMEQASSKSSTTTAPVSEEIAIDDDALSAPAGNNATNGTEHKIDEQTIDSDNKQTAAEGESSAVAATQGVIQKQQRQPPPPPKSPNASKFLSTMTKSPEEKRQAVANRFAGFKSMAGNIAAKGSDSNRFAGFKNMAAKGAERVAKVKEQIQKEDGDSNRFAGFKNMAGNMAAKGAERVAKVKDQIQKEDADGQNVNMKRFAGLKSMAGNMAAKGAERVAKVKDQIQKEDADGQNVNAKRFAGFKSMAGNIAARGAKSVASVQVPQQQRFTAAKLPSFGTGNRIENSSNSNHGTNPAIAVQTSASSPAAAPKPLPQTPAATVAVTDTNPPATNLSTSPSTPVAATNDTPSPTKEEPDLQASQMANTHGETGVETELPENSEKAPLPPQAQNISPALQNIVSTEANTNDNGIIEANNPVDDATQKSPQVDTPTLDGTDSPKDTIGLEAAGSAEESTDLLLQVSETFEDDSPKEAEKSTAPSDNVTPNPTAPKPDTNSTQSKPSPAGASNTAQVKETSHKAQQSTLPTQAMSDQVEVLQKELHAAHTLIMQLQHHDNVEEERPGDAVMVELQANLQKEMTRRAEAEDKARVAIANAKRVEEEYTTFKTVSKSNLDAMTTSVENLTQEKDAMEKELVEIREERDEQARKEMALTTRLNAAKKKEAVKANAAEHYEDQVDQLEFSVKEYESQVESLTAERDQLKVELGEWKEYAEKRTEQLEMALNDEKKLNDERKRKMKGFVEAKTEEVRAAKADYISLQTELDQTSHSLTELNQRYKQLHAQWVQSQTRNRELQRDAMKMKKDSEKMHKVGGSLEARLSRSAQQSEDHKNKRIHARNELMSVLGQLEAERAVNSRLQESIKMTFTPKALSQQQTIREVLDDFEAALQKLSTRIGRPVPPSFSNDPNAFDDGPNAGDGSLGMNDTNSDDATDTNDGSKTGSVTLSEINSTKAVQKLENETQRVSQSIVEFSSSVERMHSLLDGGGTKNCVDVLSQILMTGSPPPIKATPTRKKSGQRYGQITRNVP